MTDEELSRLLDKLKRKYAEYSVRNPTWFNRDAFEDRLATSLRNRMNMEAFILAEIANFEKVRERYEKKKGERPFSERVDRIIEEIQARIEKYPEIRFHPKAGIEIARFYGALSLLCLDYFPVLFIVVAEKPLRDRLLAFEASLAPLALPRGGRPARRIEDHIARIGRPGVREIDVERDRNEYLKESAFLLHEIAEFCDGLIEARNPEWGNPLRFDRLYIEEPRKKRVTSLFSGLTGYGAIMKVRDYALGVIEDFRLGAFRKQDGG
jgi:hypothetical protein